MIAGHTPWDRATYKGDDDAISDSVRRGAQLFFSERLECHHCHGGFNLARATYYEGSAFLEVSFHNIGLYNIDGEGAYPATDTGPIAVYEGGRRNIESGPHAGDDRENPFKGGFVRGFTLTDGERADLIAFLEALTDETFITDPRFSNPFESSP